VACARLRAWWDGGRTSSEDYLSRALLRPYVEVLARRGIAPDRVHRPGHCPVCGGAPWIAARRAESDGDGARRSLGCALCGGEWSINRIRCPCCAEEDPARLPSFQSDAHPTARLEACETCRRYVKSIDLTVDARALPEVDDLVSDRGSRASCTASRRSGGQPKNRPSPRQCDSRGEISTITMAPVPWSATTSRRQAEVVTPLPRVRMGTRSRVPARSPVRPNSSRAGSAGALTSPASVRGGPAPPAVRPSTP